MMNTYDYQDSEKSIQRCRKIAEDIFGSGWQAKGADIYKYGLGGGDNKKRADVWGMGNCHIDTGNRIF